MNATTSLPSKSRYDITWQRFSSLVAENFSWKTLDLARIREALEKRDLLRHIDPKKVILVAGTNGKGSTCASLEALLLSAGCSVGLFTSPHLLSPCERFRFNGEDFSEELFCDVFESIEKTVEEVKLSQFETYTLMAIEYFTCFVSCDYILLEVGLGGTLDATNALPHYWNVVTSIGFDHQHILGNTLEEIARNKFGILQKEGHLICGELPLEAQRVRDECLANSRVSVTSLIPYDYSIVKGTPPKYALHTPFGTAAISLLGKRGAHNSALALSVFKALGFKPSPHHLSALSSVRWPGRMEEVVPPPYNCPLFVSGDHNLQGIESLTELLRSFDYQELYCLVGICKEKEYERMLEKLYEVPRIKLLLCENVERAIPLQELPERVRKAAWYISADYRDCLAHAAREVTAHDLLLVTGSLFLVGAVKGDHKNPSS